MEMSVLFLFCVVSVSGQFLDPGYMLDNVPLPIRRTVQNNEFKIQPSIWREIQPTIYNQGRKHIDNNDSGTPYAPFNINNNQYYGNKLNALLQHQNKNNRKINDEYTKNKQRSNTHGNLFQNTEDQQSYAINGQSNDGPIIQHTQNNKNSNPNNNHNPDARAININSYRNTDSTNNKNINSNPKKRNTETANLNNERLGYQTEPTIKFKQDDKYLTGVTKSTKTSEITSKSNADGINNNDDNKWIWSNAAADTKQTTDEPSDEIVAVQERIAFIKDQCPTGQHIRYFAPGAPVLARDYRARADKWAGREAPLTYRVRCSDGRELKRHVDQLLPGNIVSARFLSAANEEINPAIELDDAIDEKPINSVNKKSQSSSPSPSPTQINDDVIHKSSPQPGPSTDTFVKPTTPSQRPVRSCRLNVSKYKL